MIFTVSSAAMCLYKDTYSEQAIKDYKSIGFKLEKNTEYYYITNQYNDVRVEINTLEELIEFTQKNI